MGLQIAGACLLHMCSVYNCNCATGLDYINYSCIDAYLGKITDGTVTPCTQEDSSRNHPVFWSWPKPTKIFSFSVIVICSTAFLCKCDYLVQWFTSAGPYVMAGVAFPLSYSLCEPIYVNLFYNY